MLKGLKINKGSGASRPQTKKWQKQYTDVVTKDQLVKQHEQIMDLFLKGQTDKLIVAQQALKLKQQHYFEHANQPSANELFTMQASPPNIQSTTNNSKFSSNLQYEEERPNNKHQRRSEAQQVYKFIPSPKVISNCRACPENGHAWIASSSQYIYLSVPRRKQFANLSYFHLCPVEHVSSSLKLEAEVYEELNNYKKCLIQLFDSLGQHAIFFESYSRDNSHLTVECLAIPPAKAHDLPFFFKQGLITSEGDWTTNKSIIEIRKEKGGLLKQIPRNFKYFYVDFSLGYGYAHIIEEEEQKWRDEFAHQILASMLGMEQHEVLTTEEHTQEELQRKAARFQQSWKPYDWTALL